MTDGPVAFAYGRHSTKKQSLTRKTQLSLCRRYYQNNLKHKGVRWHDFYYDAAVQGSKPFSERQYGRQVYAGLRPGDHFIISKLDRGFRSVVDGSATLDALANRGVVIHVCDLNVDTSTTMGRFFLNILLCVGQLEREFASERTAETIAYRKSRGLPYCYSAPIGWRITGKKPNRRYRIDATERRLCDELQRLKDDGWSQEDIADWCRRQNKFRNKRRFTDRTSVRQALLAREWGYPKLLNGKVMRKLAASGQIADYLAKLGESL